MEAIRSAETSVTHFTNLRGVTSEETFVSSRLTHYVDGSSFLGCCAALIDTDVSKQIYSHITLISVLHACTCSFTTYNIYFYQHNAMWPISVTMRSKACVCGCSLPGIVGSNPAGGMQVCLL